MTCGDSCTLSINSEKIVAIMMSLVVSLTAKDHLFQLLQTNEFFAIVYRAAILQEL